MLEHGRTVDEDLYNVAIDQNTARSFGVERTVVHDPDHRALRHLTRQARKLSITCQRLNPARLVLTLGTS